METSFPSEIVVPGVFVRVQAENLITAGGVSSGNIGIVGTAAAAVDVRMLLVRLTSYQASLMPGISMRPPMG
ncbi:MAG: hypothetical protein JKY24_03500 [Pseudomonadales bacterium]|nr:hypothetical protein [Pseudomonadales bacterium]